MLIDQNIKLSISTVDSFTWYFYREIVISVLNNALNNASRYTKSAIELVATEENGYLVIEIHDDGNGYPKLLLDSPPGEILNNINFQTGSTSLGIYFAEMVTRLHTHKERQGSIKLANGGRLGGGVFSIHLP